MTGCTNAVIKWGNLKRNEEVVIVTDTKVDPTLILGLEAVCSCQGASVNTIWKDAQELPHQEPPKPVAAAMAEADLIIMCTSVIQGHTSATFNALSRGARFLCIGPSLEAMAARSAKFPPEIIFELATRISDQWSNGKVIRVTCDKGTDMRANIIPEEVIGREGAGAPLGIRLKEGRPKKGRIAFWEGGFGTVGVWPGWDSEGVAVFDAAQGFQGKLKTPLKYHVSQGYVTKFEGDSEQLEFYENVRERFGKDAWHLGEIMIGLNPWVDILQGLSDTSHLHAHRAAGTVHMALGNSVDDFRTVKPGIHLDNLIFKPTITIDDEICVDNGHIVLFDDPEIRKMMKEFGVEL